MLRSKQILTFQVDIMTKWQDTNKSWHFRWILSQNVKKTSKSWHFRWILKRNVTKQTNINLSDRYYNKMSRNKLILTFQVDIITKYRETNKSWLFKWILWQNVKKHYVSKLDKSACTLRKEVLQSTFIGASGCHK